MSGGMKIQVYSKYGTPVVAGNDFVKGPASTPITDSTIALWDGTTGRLIKSTSAAIDGAGHLQDVIVELGWLEVDAAAPNRFLTRDGSGNVVDTANPSLANLLHDHEDAAGGGLLDAAAIGSGVFDVARIPAFPYFLFADLQTKGTSGGASSATTWHTRVLNTEVADTAGIASVSSNAVSLPAGTYYFRGSAPAFIPNVHHLVLWNDTDSTLALNATNEWSAAAASVQTRSFVQGVVTISGTKAFTLRHYFQSAQAVNGLGVVSNINNPGGASLQEVYAILEGWKIG